MPDIGQDLSAAASTAANDVTTTATDAGNVVMSFLRTYVLAVMLVCVGLGIAAGYFLTK